MDVASPRVRGQPNSPLRSLASSLIVQIGLLVGLTSVRRLSGMLLVRRGTVSIRLNFLRSIFNSWFTCRCYVFRASWGGRDSICLRRSALPSDAPVCFVFAFQAAFLLDLAVDQQRELNRMGRIRWKRLTRGLGWSPVVHYNY